MTSNQKATMTSTFIHKEIQPESSKGLIKWNKWGNTSIGGTKAKGSATLYPGFHAIYRAPLYESKYIEEASDPF
jgi:hypothetical protein